MVYYKMTDSRVTGKKIRSLFFLALSYGQENKKAEMLSLPTPHVGLITLHYHKD